MTIVLCLLKILLGSGNAKKKNKKKEERKNEILLLNCLRLFNGQEQIIHSQKSRKSSKFIANF
jgi:hypothetical protein